MKPRFQRGAIWEVDFGPIPKSPETIHEIRKKRPAVIVSNNKLNGGWVIAVVPITDERNKLDQNNRPLFPNHVLLGDVVLNGLSKLCVAECEQVKSIDPSKRITAKQKIGELTKDQMEAIADALTYTFDTYTTHKRLD